MRGTWSMVFRGRKTDMAKLLAGLERVGEDPDCQRYESFYRPLRKAAKELSRLPGNGKRVLRADGTWKDGILGLTDAMETLHRFAPRTEASCRTGIEAYYYVDYLAPGAEKSLFTELKRAGEPEYEGEASGIVYEEIQLSAEQGGTQGWKIEKGRRYVLRLWETW